MQKMARDYLEIPSTGCSIEREFNISGCLVTKHRNRMVGRTISDLMFLKRSVARGGEGFSHEVRPVASITVEAESEDEDNVDEKDRDIEEMDLLEWLKHWQKEKKLSDAAEELRSLNVS